MSNARVSSLRAVAAIGKVTFLEIIREKVLYNVLVVAFLIFGLGILASKCTFVAPGRVVLDFGYSALNVSCLLLAILMGSGLLGKEFDRRTAFVALSHPISTLHFVFGKFWGLIQILLVNWSLLVGVYVFLLAGQSETFGWSSLSLTFLSALWLALVQSIVIGGIAIFFSSFSTTSLAVIFSVGLYLVGINNSELRLLATRVESQVGKVFLNSISTSLPNFEYFNLGIKLTYDLPISLQFVLMSTAYGFVIATLCLLLSGVLVTSKTR